MTTKTRPSVGDTGAVADERLGIRLPNGLDVLIRRIEGATAVATCMQVDVGCRTEPVAGAAHLVEHLLGGPLSLNQEKAQAVFALGGRSNARTALDYTQYTHIVPSVGLRLALERETERLSVTSVSRAAIGEQIEVVRAEIRRNILQRPHGGLVMFELPKLLHSSFANAHNGYGDLEAIASIGPEEVEEFLTTLCVPANAHLVVTGDVVPEQVLQHLDALGQVPGPARSLPRCNLAEPLSEPRRAVRRDSFATDTRTAWGFTVPDPLTDSEAYLSHVMLSETLDAHPHILEGGATARRVRWRVNRTGNPFDVAAPSLMAVDSPHRDGESAEQIEDGFRQALLRLVENEGLRQALTATRRQTCLALLSDLDSVLSTASWSAVGRGVFDDDMHQERLVGKLESVTVDAVLEAASSIAQTPAARLTSVPR